ncbi:MAG: flagellar export chaperone FliS [Spirochaetaceae bacterium 4572_7]|nr:MAG: flagellar export chaperone FliS [Spirochaetaceae bacterium 4572_7]
MRRGALNSYKETKVTTATQSKLIIMLYDEAIRKIDLAVEAVKSNKAKDISHNAYVKSQDCISELMVSLDLEKGGEIAQNLFSLYNYFNKELLDANTHNKPEKALEIRNMMNDLRGSWIAISGKTQYETSKDRVGINIAG